MGHDEFGDPELSLHHTMLAGSAAGMSEHCVMFPLDTIKTRIMSEDQARYTRTVQTARLIVRDEGFMALYKGIGPALSSAVPAHAVLFTSYEFVKRHSSQWCSPHVSCMLGAAAATCLHDTVSTPFDVVKQRMQVAQHPTSLQCLRYTLATEGVWAFVRSLPATYLMNFPHQAVHWLTYESAKLLTGKEVEEHIAMDHFVCGAIAGVCSSFVSNPLDLLRTRIQLGHKHTAFECVRHTYLVEGISGFWKGAVPRMMFNAPSAALTMTTYEVVKKFLMSLNNTAESTTVAACEA